MLTGNILCFLVLATVQISSVLSQSLSHGESCGPSDHCAVNVGLICGPQLNCQCGNGTLNGSLKYAMTWDATKSKCVAIEGSACVGTEENATDKEIVCSSGLKCEQISTMPPGVGACVREETYQSHGQPCGPDRHCVINKGLICDEGKCECGNGTASDSLKYIMAWDPSALVCVAMEGGACINIGQNQVNCKKGLTCEQELSLPSGVGRCISPDVTVSTTPPSSSTGKIVLESTLIPIFILFRFFFY